MNPKPDDNETDLEERVKRQEKELKKQKRRIRRLEARPRPPSPKYDWGIGDGLF